MKALISDFDGTLYFHYNSPRVKIIDMKKIQKFQKCNLFILCTGRHMSSVQILNDYSIQCDYYICASGAIIINKMKELIYKQPLQKNIVNKILNKYSDYYLYVLSESKIYHLNNSVDEKSNVNVIDNVDQITENILGISINANSVDNAKNIVNYLNKNYNVTALQNGQYIDVVSSNCSKGKAVGYLKKLLNLDIVGTIGDSYNDIDMLNKSDISFTFPSSPDEVKNAAKYEVSGVAEAIEILENI